MTSRGRPPSIERRRWIWVALIFGALLIASGTIYVIHRSSQSDTESASTETTAAATVSASDEDITELPQNPSLRFYDEEGATYVENDGNVTMSDVAVVDGAGASVCDLGTLSPGDRATCDVSGALDPVSAVGSGPQGQEVKVTAE